MPLQRRMRPFRPTGTRPPRRSLFARCQTRTRPAAPGQGLRVRRASRPVRSRGHLGFAASRSLAPGARSCRSASQVAGLISQSSCDLTGPAGRDRPLRRDLLRGRRLARRRRLPGSAGQCSDHLCVGDRREVAVPTADAEQLVRDREADDLVGLLADERHRLPRSDRDGDDDSCGAARPQRTHRRRDRSARRQTVVDHAHHAPAHVNSRPAVATGLHAPRQSVTALDGRVQSPQGARPPRAATARPPRARHHGDPRTPCAHDRPDLPDAMRSRRHARSGFPPTDADD